MKEILKYINIPILCILLGLMFQTIASVFTKIAALNMESFTTATISTNTFYFVSLLCMGLNAITWQIVLKKYPLSVVYYVNSSLLVIMLFVSRFYFDETITDGNILGSIFIIFGLLFLIKKS